MSLLAAEMEKKRLVLVLVGFLQWAGENCRELGGLDWTRCASDLRRGEPLHSEEGGVTFMPITTVQILEPDRLVSV